MPNTRAHYGVNSLQNGSEYYRACLKWHLSFDMTPDEVHQVGVQEVERIHGDMKKVCIPQMNKSCLFVLNNYCAEV